MKLAELNVIVVDARVVKMRVTPELIYGCFRLWREIPSRGPRGTTRRCSLTSLTSCTNWSSCWTRRSRIQSCGSGAAEKRPTAERELPRRRADESGRRRSQWRLRSSSSTTRTTPSGATRVSEWRRTLSVGLTMVLWHDVPVESWQLTAGIRNLVSAFALPKAKTLSVRRGGSCEDV